MSSTAIIITCLISMLALSLFYLVRFGLIILQIQDAIEESLDVMDEKYKSMSSILERPLYYDSPEVRQVVQDIRDTRASILYIANAFSLSGEPIHDDLPGE